MKLKLTIKCNPVSNDDLADEYTNLFMELECIAEKHGQMKLAEAFENMCNYYCSSSSLPKK